MALARTTVLSANSGSDHGTGTYVTGSFTPSDNSLLVVAVCAMERDGTTDPSGDLTVSGGGWTYTAKVNVGAVGFWSHGVRIWTAPVATGASMTLTFDCAARNIFRYVTSVVAYTGYNTSTPTSATGTNAAPGNDGAQSLTLSASPATTSEVVAALGSDTGTGSTAGTGWTEIHDNQALGDVGIQTQVRTGSTSSTVGWDDVGTGGAAADIVLAAVEILESAADLTGFLDLESTDEVLLESGDIYVLEAGAPGGSGATVTPGVIARSFAIPQSAVSVGAATAVVAKSVVTPLPAVSVSAAPAIVSRAATVPVSAVSVGAAPVVIARSFTIPQVIASESTIIAPDTIARAFVVSAPTVSIGAAPAVVARVFTLPQPVVGVGATTAVIARAFTVPQVTADGGGAGGAIVNPDAIVRAFAIHQPAVSIGVVPSPLAVIATFLGFVVLTDNLPIPSGHSLFARSDSYAVTAGADVGLVTVDAHAVIAGSDSHAVEV